MKRLNIVFIAAHACIRVQKMAIPLLEAGHNVHLMAQKIPSFSEGYKSVHYYTDAGQLIEAIDLFEKSGKVDLYHCHNEPSWFVTLLKERTNKPVVLDVHDTFLTRSTPEEDDEANSKGKDDVRITVEERTNFQLADALVFVSETVKDITVEEFGLNQPNLVLPSYLPEAWYRYNFGRWLGGLVYEGKVIRQSELDNARATGFHYCDYRDTATQCKEIGMDFHLYAGGNEPEIQKMYEDTAILHPGVPFRQLIHDISRHDWGLVGNTLKSSQWDKTLPNKLFEYFGAGIPVVAINAKESSDIINQYEMGVTVDSIKELGSQWKRHRELRANVIKRRHEFAMERHIPRLESFYGELVNG
jgi:glycosyltransferase involved in cell wall biosynthesis